MAFKFTDELQFDWPVTIKTPEAGGHVETTFTGLFLEIPDLEFFEEIGSERMSDMIEGEIARLMRVFVGWPAGAVVDDNGAEFPPTEENRRKLLSRRANRMAVSEAYRDASMPKTGARAKNSAGPPG